MKIKKSSGTSILRFEEEAGDSRQLFEIDSKYTEISHDASEDVKNGGAKYLTIPPSVKLIGDKAFANLFILERMLLTLEKERLLRFHLPPLFIVSIKVNQHHLIKNGLMSLPKILSGDIKRKQNNRLL